MFFLNFPLKKKALRRVNYSRKFCHKVWEVCLSPRKFWNFCHTIFSSSFSFGFKAYVCSCLDGIVYVVLNTHPDEAVSDSMYFPTFISFVEFIVGLSYAFTTPVWILMLYEIVYLEMISTSFFQSIQIRYIERKISAQNVLLILYHCLKNKHSRQTQYHIHCTINNINSQTIQIRWAL